MSSQEAADPSKMGIGSDSASSNHVKERNNPNAGASPYFFWGWPINSDKGVDSIRTKKGNRLGLQGR